jgi:hypothetical protein
MADHSELSWLGAAAGQLRRGAVESIDSDGFVHVRSGAAGPTVRCLVLQSGPAWSGLREADEVLYFTDPQGDTPSGVVLGRIGPYGETPAVTLPQESPNRRPLSLVLEAQGEIVLKNARARIRLSPEGDIEFVGESFSSRCRRLVRLLAPLVKLN